MLDALPRAKAMLGDKGYDADWFRNALIKRGIVPCIPSKANRKIPIAHDQTLYRQRHKIENMFGKLKDWRRIHTRYDRCAHTFFSAICIAATIIFWINQSVLTLEKAAAQYLEVEKEIGKGGDKDAVLVSVNSIASLRRAYPNYFADTHIFVGLLRQALS
jgi:transposase